MENAYLQLPVEADCSNDHVPVPGQHKAKVMDGGITMTKYLFSHYRLTLYSFLNQVLRDGTLSQAVGFKVLNKRINREVCSFPMGGVSFWKIDRENFYADVKVELKLQNEEGRGTGRVSLRAWSASRGRSNSAWKILPILSITGTMDVSA